MAIPQVPPLGILRLVCRRMALLSTHRSPCNFLIHTRIAVISLAYMGFSAFEQNMGSQAPEDGQTLGPGQDREGGPSERKLKEIGGRLRTAFFKTIEGRTFTLHNASSGIDSTVVATGKRDSSDYIFVKEIGSGHSSVASEAMILRSKEGRAEIELMLDNEDLSGEQKEKVIGELGLYPN